MDALPQPHVNLELIALGRVKGVVKDGCYSLFLFLTSWWVLAVLLLTGFGHQEVQPQRMGPSGRIIPRGYLHLGSSQILPSVFSQWHLNLSSSFVLVFHVLLRHLYYSLNSFVLEAALNKWSNQSCWN